MNNSHQILGKSPKLTILYLRLSKGDIGQGESNSITNQRRLLTEYAERNGFTPYECVVDDDHTGTNYDRPGWQEIMLKVEADEVSTLIVKNIDRMGRNYLESGLLRAMFEEKEIRLIAVNDGIDTFEREDDFLPFREIMAEHYARDTSRKIKSVLKNKGRDGKPLSNIPPYGFIKDPANKNAWLTDEHAASVVRRIFQLTIDGNGPYKIAHILYDDNVERPSYYLATRGRGSNQSDCDYGNPCAWNGRTIIEMIAKPEYAGHTVNFRTNKKSFKSKKTTKNDPSEWLIFENTHPAIVPQETWDLAQKCRETKRRTNEQGIANPLTGLMFCHECKRKMYHHGTKKQRRYFTVSGEERFRENADYYKCSSQSLSRQKFNPVCTPHQIRTSAVLDIILDVLRRTAGYVREYEKEFIGLIRESSELRQGETAKSHKKNITKNERRIAELDKLITGLYESMMKSLISEERFKVMSENYEREQSELKEQNVKLQAELEAYTSDSDKAENFIALVRRYTSFEELTGTLINEFIDRIEVHEAVWNETDEETGYKGVRTQKIDVYLKYIGRFDAPDTRTPEELEAERVAEEKLMKQRESNRRYARRKRAAAAAAKQSGDDAKEVS